MQMLASIWTSPLNWLVGLYVAHPVVVPLVGGIGIATVFFLVRKLIQKGVKLAWKSVSAGVRGLTWPIRKLYGVAFVGRVPGARHSSFGGRLPLINERAYFGPDETVGLKTQRLVIVTAMYGGFYRGRDLLSGADIMCSPDRVQAA